MKIRNLLVSLLALVCVGAYAQEGGVKGKVVSRDGRAALSNVKVIVEPLGVSVMTDDEGHSISASCPRATTACSSRLPSLKTSTSWSASVRRSRRCTPS